MTSASTLIRRARKAKNPRVAKRLRTMAAKLRRAARDKAASTSQKAPAKRSTKSKKKPAKRRTRTKVSAADPLAGVAGINRDNDIGWQVRREGQGLGAQASGESMPLIDGDGIEMLRTLGQHTYQPGEVDQFAIGLRARLVEAKVKGREQADETNTNLLKTVHEVNGIQVVSAFMAEIEGIQALHRGTLPPTIMTSGFTVKHIFNALRDAGYTTEGKGGVNRASLQAARR